MAATVAEDLGIGASCELEPVGFGLAQAIWMNEKM
jgi:hypothetical protein